MRRLCQPCRWWGRVLPRKGMRSEGRPRSGSLPSFLAVHVQLEDENEDVRWATVKALEKLEAAAPGTHAAALVTKLEDQSWLVRRATMKVLGELEVAGLSTEQQAKLAAARCVIGL